MLKPIAFFACLTMAAVPGFAKDRTYSCQVDVPKSQGWVPPAIVIRHKEGSKEAVVNDPIITYFNKKPAVAKVVADNDARITFTWELSNITNRAGQVAPRFLYRASYYKKTGKVNVSAKPANYDNVFTAYGTCSVK